MEVIHVNTEEQRLRGLVHKRQLEKLPTFSLRLEYWLENINSYPDPVIYVSDETELFELRLDPTTDADRFELHRVWMQSDARDFAERNAEVNESVVNNKVSFYVKSLDDLKSDLEQRLSNVIRKRDLLQKELDSTTNSIDVVCRPVNDFHRPDFAPEIKELRSRLELDKPYDFTFKNERFPQMKATRLAMVWDIIQYEKYLKDEIYNLDKGQSDQPQTGLFSEKRKNCFNNMPLDQVERWFLQLAGNTSKSGEPFLRVEQIKEFIERAFCGEPFTEKITITTSRGGKGKIVGLFHLYYHECATHQSKIGKIDPELSTGKYIRLLTDYFDNWSFDDVKHNFRSGGSWKKQSI